MERFSELEKEVRRYHQVKIIPISFCIVMMSVYIFSKIVGFLPLPDYVIEGLASDNYFRLAIMSLVLLMSYSLLHRLRMRKYKLEEILKTIDGLEDGRTQLNQELIDDIKKLIN